ncbi:MAG: response regulator [Ramlibacter sp.]|nr:response regulator [Ramlibacter sp.]
MTIDPVRVLVVDDVADVADTLAAHLELDGYEVFTAYDGMQALSKIEEFAPDCILFDIDMPGLDGFEMSKQIRERHGNDIVLIAVTARGRQDPRVAGAFVVADHYLIKPVDIAVLRTVLPPLRPV